jgi:hypothetical protein
VEVIGLSSGEKDAAGDEDEATSSSGGDGRCIRDDGRGIGTLAVVLGPAWMTLEGREMDEGAEGRT